MGSGLRERPSVGQPPKRRIEVPQAVGHQRDEPGAAAVGVPSRPVRRPPRSGLEGTQRSCRATFASWAGGPRLRLPLARRTRKPATDPAVNSCVSCDSDSLRFARSGERCEALPPRAPWRCGTRPAAGARTPRPPQARRRRGPGARPAAPGPAPCTREGRGGRGTSAARTAARRPGARGRISRVRLSTKVNPAFGSHDGFPRRSGKVASSKHCVEWMAESKPICSWYSTHVSPPQDQGDRGCLAGANHQLPVHRLQHLRQRVHSRRIGVEDLHACTAAKSARRATVEDKRQSLQKVGRFDARNYSKLEARQSVGSSHGAISTRGPRGHGGRFRSHRALRPSASQWLRGGTLAAAPRHRGARHELTRPRPRQRDSKTNDGEQQSAPGHGSLSGGLSVEANWGKGSEGLPIS